MPPRWLCVLIVLLWLLSTGPLVWKELRPLLLTNQPPGYSVGLLDDARGEKQAIRWTVHLGDGEPADQLNAHAAESWVETHPRQDEVTFHTRLTASRLRVAPLRFGPLTLHRIETAERIDRREFQLRRFSFEMVFDAEVPFVGKIERARCKAEATAEAGKLRGTLDLALQGTEAVRFDIPEVQLPNSGKVELPLHLYDKVEGLYPGRTWLVPMIDPVRSIPGFLQGGGKVEVKNVPARVLDRVEPLPGHPDLPCHVIVYETETRPKIYVQVGKQLLLRQETVYDGQRIVIQRAQLYPER